MDLALDIADLVDKVVTTIAVVVGAVWAYYQFGKNRTYRPRLDVDVTGDLLDEGATRLLRAVVTVSSRSLTKVTIRQSGTALSVSACVLAAQPDAPYERAVFTDEEHFSILTDHEWIEPGEAVTDEVLVTAPSTGVLAFRVAARVIPDVGRRSPEIGAVHIVAVQRPGAGSTPPRLDAATPNLTTERARSSHAVDARQEGAPEGRGQGQDQDHRQDEEVTQP